MLTSEGLYNEIVARHIRFDTHESDLYIPVTKETIALVEDYEYSSNVTVFYSEGSAWYDIPFANMGFWKTRMQRVG